MFVADHLTLDAPKRTKDGYLAVRAKAARTGVYRYSGRDVDPDNKQGLRDQASVNVLRDDAAVFDQRAVRSFLMKPITDDHPTTSVTAANWKDHARGVVAGAIRDGDHLAFDLILMDGALIGDVEAGKRELSNGYDCKLEFGDFTAADGTKCQARQDMITGNHVAVVRSGRAGPSCRIGDVALCDALPSSLIDTQEKPVKKIMLDGLTVDIADADTAEATVRKLETERNEAKAKLGDADSKVATLTAEKATLEQQLKHAKPSPQQLRDAARSYSLTIGKAKALGVAVTDAMDEPAIMQAAVTAKLGDAAKDWTADQVAAAFAVLAKDAKVQVADPLRDAISRQPANLNDAETAAADARTARLDRFATAHSAKAA